MEVPKLLLLDKPLAMTSFGLVARVRRIVGVKKVGHAGTLDPLATGLMLLGIGEGTKALTKLVKLDKEYEAEILIGQRRSTSDMEGEVVEEKEVTEIFSDEKISATLATFIGTTNLPVSAYSAIKVDGMPMYKRARKAAESGDVVEDVPYRNMKVYEAELLHNQALEFENKKFQLIKVRFAVGSGTYIRSLAEELGNRLGYPATIYSLRRTKVGEYKIEDALTLEVLAKQFDGVLY